MAAVAGQVQLALVTGSTGFVGAHVARGLLDHGYRVRAFHRVTSSLRLLDGLDVEHVTGDLTQPETIQAAMEGVDVVFHAAAWMGGSRPAGRQYAVTVEGTRDVLAAAHKAGVRRVVHTSSVAALGVPNEMVSGTTGLMNENHAWNFRPDFYPYGYAKYLAELEVQKAVASGLDVVIVNPSLVYGAGDVYRQSGSIITQVAERRISVAIEGGVNCVHIDDVVRGHISALENGVTGERYILGGENLSILDMLTMIAEVTGVPAPNIVLPGWLVRSVGGPAHMLEGFLSLPISTDLLRLAGFNFFYDLTKAETVLGLTDRRPVREAIEEAAAWFQPVGEPGG